MAKEYIEREAIEVELQEELDFESPMYTAEQNKHINIGLKIALRAIKKAPAADVVEVVRCGECKSWCPISNGKAGTCKGKVQGVTKPDDFCSYGERRGDPTKERLLRAAQQIVDAWEAGD